MIQVPTNPNTESANSQEVTATKGKRDAYILESLRRADPMIRGIARRSVSDYDDLYQVAAEVTLKHYERAQQAMNPRAYLHRAIRNAILTYAGIAPRTSYELLAHRYQIVSFDAPLARDSDFSLYDLTDEAMSPQISKIRDFSHLYATLSVLPPTYREVICMRFGLCGYSVYRPCEIARLLGIHQDTERYRFHRALAVLQQHIELLDLVES